jgi:hypothetical protein
MKISKENYEIWFMDFADGKLSNEQKLCLKQFLDLHPELKSEFEIFCEVNSIHFIPEFEAAPGKSSLKKSIQSTATIRAESYAAFLIADLENDLSENERAELAEFIDKNPGVKKEQSLFYKTKLRANEKLVFPKKKSLKKTLIFGLRPVVYAGIAAAAVFIGFIFSLFQNNSNLNITDFNPIVKIAPPEKIAPNLNTRIKNAPNTFHETEHLASVKNKPTIQKKLESPEEIAVPLQEAVLLTLATESSTLLKEKESPVFQPADFEAYDVAQVSHEKTVITAAAELFSTISGSKTIEKNVKEKKRFKAFDFVRTGFEIASRRGNSNSRITEKPTTGGHKKVHLFTPLFEAEFAMKSE